MTRQLFTASLGFGLLMILASHAFGQTARNCGPRDKVVSTLGDLYGETRQSIGIGTSGQVMEVYANLDEGTWTITITLPSGMTCLMASGQSFEALAEEVPAKDGTAL
ncbi:MAG: hypothetical protein AAGK37_06275 [Pseudomonadota bacterium]